MAQSTMYPPKSGSPKTELSANITASDTTITVENGNYLPDAPNLAVIGSNDNAEVIIYTAKSGNTLSGITRGVGGSTASVWTAGTSVARNFTALDHQTLINNINDLASNKANAADMGGIQVRPNYIISTTDLTAGSSTLASGTVYFYYEAS